MIIFNKVTTILEKETCKKFALKHAGEIFKFRDGPFNKILGRIVGYYFNFAYLVMETDEVTHSPIDPLHAALDHNGIPLTAGSFYTYAKLSALENEVGVEDTDKSLIYPHTCNMCQSPALIMFRTVECSSKICKNYLKKR